MYRADRFLGLLLRRTLLRQPFYAASFHKANAEEQRRCTAVSLRSRCEKKHSEQGVQVSKLRDEAAIWKQRKSNSSSDAGALITISC